MAQSTITTTTGEEATRVTAAELLINSPDPSSPENAINESQFPEPLWRAAIAATRFGYGLRPGELQIIAQDPKGWLVRQINDTSTPDEIQGLSKSRDHLQNFMKAQNEGREGLFKFRESARQNAMWEIGQHELAAFNSPNPFRERLVRFFVNQFNLSGQDEMMYPMTVQFEREVIRPYLNRTYYHLLLAAYQHPAMLIYHNNNRSIAPTSPTGDKIKVEMNESMAREILERHTMGPQGEYTETDVEGLTAMLTGWTVGGLGSRNPGGFMFKDSWHDRNQKMFMKRIFPNAGMMEFEAAVDMIGRTPRTAWTLATNMAKEFVSDTPTDTLVTHMVRGFLNASGNIMGMAHAMIESEEAWTPVPGKVKTPQHLVISTYKALDRNPQNGRDLVRQQTQLGQPPYQPHMPTGWPKQSAHWVTSDLYADRIEWLTQIAAEDRLNAEPVDQGIAVLGPKLRPATARHIAIAPSKLDSTALLLCSPEFQRV
ncbi:DUF1800 domain-containing protein [Curvivirga sp.]|uniref:DUF1800 domain-containing protein n=1 Tax=Curvivirga sp. TaxID=2856848 RepID=UPI003B5CAD1E